jgi:hypothetical protein
MNGRICSRADSGDSVTGAAIWTFTGDRLKCPSNSRARRSQSRGVIR